MNQKNRTLAKLSFEFLESRRLLASGMDAHERLPAIDAEHAMVETDKQHVRSLHESWSDHSVAGDSNLDGQVDLVDIVQALQAGKYRTSKPASWSEGAWNDDGVFDHGDILAAFQALRHQPITESDDSLGHLRDKGGSPSDGGDSTSGSDSARHVDAGARSEIELHATLRGLGAETCTAEWQVEHEHGRGKKELNVELRGAQPGSTHEVLVDFVSVGEIEVDEHGQGRLLLSTHPDAEYALPVALDVASGTHLQVGTILSGDFEPDDQSDGLPEDDSDDNVAGESEVMGDESLRSHDSRDSDEVEGEDDDRDEDDRDEDDRDEDDRDEDDRDEDDRDEDDRDEDDRDEDDRDEDDRDEDDRDEDDRDEDDRDEDDRDEDDRDEDDRDEG